MAKSESKPVALPMFIINKTPTGLTRVSVSEYKGKMSLDFRHNYCDGEGKFKPTPKGCSIPLTLAKKLHARLGKLIDEAEALVDHYE